MRERRLWWGLKWKSSGLSLVSVWELGLLPSWFINVVRSSSSFSSKPKTPRFFRDEGGGGKGEMGGCVGGGDCLAFCFANIRAGAECTPPPPSNVEAVG